MVPIAGGGKEIGMVGEGNERKRLVKETSESNLWNVRKKWSLLIGIAYGNRIDWSTTEEAFLSYKCEKNFNKLKHWLVYNELQE